MRRLQSTAASSSSELARKVRVLAPGAIGNHPLPEGNKRVSYLCAVEFVARNGGTWTSPPDDLEPYTRGEVVTYLRRAGLDDLAIVGAVTPSWAAVVPAMRDLPAVVMLAAEDEELFAVVRRVGNLLEHPQVHWDGPAITAQVETFLEGASQSPQVGEGPLSCCEFGSLVGV